MFVLVKNLTQKLILETPVLTQIYPFQVNSSGITIKVLGEEIKFKFTKTSKINEINNLKNQTIYINQQ